MGAADGVIMPTIIASHITNIRTNSIALQGAAAGIIQPSPAGIIRKPVMSMPPMLMSSASQMV
jgi:hypothetical protein